MKPFKGSSSDHKFSYVILGLQESGPHLPLPLTSTLPSSWKVLLTFFHLTCTHLLRLFSKLLSSNAFMALSRMSKISHPSRNLRVLCHLVGLTLCGPMNCSLPGSSIHGISQAITLEWVAISFPRGYPQTRDKPAFLRSSTLAGRFFNTSATWEATLPITNLPAAAAKLLQSCPTLCDPRDGSPPGSPVPGILQARTLESVAISFSNAWKWKVKGKSLSHVRLVASPWTAAHQAPLSMRFSRQEYWSGVPLPSPNLPTQTHIAVPIFSLWAPLGQGLQLNIYIPSS